MNFQLFSRILTLLMLSNSVSALAQEKKTCEDAVDLILREFKFGSYRGTSPLGTRKNTLDGADLQNAQKAYNTGFGKWSETLAKLASNSLLARYESGGEINEYGMENLKETLLIELKDYISPGKSYSVSDLVSVYNKKEKSEYADLYNSDGYVFRQGIPKGTDKIVTLRRKLSEQDALFSGELEDERDREISITSQGTSITSLEVLDPHPAGLPMSTDTKIEFSSENGRCVINKFRSRGKLWNRTDLSIAITPSSCLKIKNAKFTPERNTRADIELMASVISENGFGANSY